MAIQATIIVEESGRMIIPLELNQYLDLKNYDWLKVQIEARGIVIIPPKALDEEKIEDLIHAGILIDIK
jgi:bifunctional DNA-binding transcriptional regulator/antitoxin component of YhaV-PrlF toxin-antitoxin module